MKYQLFAAPPQEPISGEFAEWPLVEAIFMSGLFALVGVGAVLFPFVVNSIKNATTKAALPIKITGIVFILFGALNFFTHIGLIVNTM